MGSIPQKYVGIDIHKKFSQVAVMDKDGTVEAEERFEHNDAETMLAFFSALGENVAAVIEPTCGWMWMVEELEKLGIEMHLAHPPAVALIAKSHIKTDKVDAKALATLKRVDALPEAYIAPREVRDQRMLLQFRQGIKKIRTMTKCRIHAHLLRYNLTGPPVSDLFGALGREYLEEVALPHYARAILDEQLGLLDYLKAMMKRIEKRIYKIVKADARATLLMTIPGIAQLTAHLLLAEIGDMKRFRNVRAFVSYCGLCPSTHQSGSRMFHGHTYGGRRCLKWALVESAQTAARYAPPLRRKYEAKKAQKGAGKATVVIAHKLARIVYYVLRDETPYNPAPKKKRIFKMRRSSASASSRLPLRASV